MGSTMMHATTYMSLLHLCGLSYDTRVYNKRLFKRNKRLTNALVVICFVAKLVLLLQKVASF